MAEGTETGSVLLAVIRLVLHGSWPAQTDDSIELEEQRIFFRPHHGDCL